MRYNISPSIEDFKSFMAEHGYSPDIGEPGEIFRFNTNGKRDKSGWGVFYADPPAGACGDWRTGETFTWSGVARSHMTKAEREAFQIRMKEAQKARKKAQEEAQAKAAEKARGIWAKAVPASPEHPYLQRKGLKPVGDIKQYGKALVVALRTFDGVLHNLQFISGDGSKRFLRDGRVKGCCFWIKGQDGVTYVGEGVCTLLSVHLATGQTCIAAMNAGNIGAVVENLMEAKPGVEIVLCADDDRWNEGGNVGIEKAQAVAIKHSHKMVAPRFQDVSSRPTDFDDLRRLEGIEAVKAQVEAAEVPSEQAQAAEWPEPVPLTEYDLPMLDCQLLGGPVGRFVEALSRTSETPPELPAGLCLGVVAVACQGKFRVETSPGHTEPVNLYVAPSLDSGNRKSSVGSDATEPLSEYERRVREELAPEIRRARSKRESQEARIKTLRNQYAKAKTEDLSELENEILRLESELEEIPSAPQIVAQDVTPEMLAVIMSQNNERGAVISSEGGVLDVLGGGRYNNGRPNLDLFLQAHSGDFVSINRIGRDPIMMESPCLTVVISPQPIVLQDMRKLPGFWGRGLINRFLFFLPPSPLGMRELRGDPLPQGVVEEYHRAITALLEIKEPLDSQGRKLPYILRLEPQAFQVWRDFSLVIEGLMREGESMEFCRGWASKLPGAAGRIAGLLHCLEHAQPWTQRISAPTMERALDLAAVFLAHARAVFGLMGADASIEGARRVWKWIDRERQPSFTKRDCHYCLKGVFQRVADLEAPLSVLEERHYIRAETIKTGGRPSVAYQVNPHIVKGWKDGLA